MTCYSYHTEILNLWYAKCLGNEEFIIFEKYGVMFTGQSHLSKGNFPFNLDNTLNIVPLPFWNKRGHSEQYSSNFPNLVIDRNNNCFLYSYFRNMRVSLSCQTSTPLHWYKVFFASKQFELISRLIWYFHGILIYMFMKFQNSFKFLKDSREDVSIHRTNLKYFGKSPKTLFHSYFHIL